MRLITLKASGVRGIPRGWPDLPIDRKGLIIYGPNGVGKSSIVDAIEYALTEKSTLFSENRQGVNWETASPHVIDGAGQITITILDGSTPRDVQPGVPTNGLSSNASAWLRAARKSSFVLRRHMLLRFIGEKPADRYGLMERFFDMEAFSPIEVTLQAHVDDLGNKKAQYESYLRTAGRQLRGIFSIPQTSSVSEATCLTVLNIILSELGLAACDNRLSLSERKNQVETLLGGKDTSARLAALGSVKTRLQQLGSVSGLLPLFKNLLSSLEALERELTTKSDEVSAEFLEAGKCLIESASLDNCPLCEGHIAEREVLVERLNSRIAADAKITASKKQVETSSRLLLKEASELSNAIRQFATEWQAAIGATVPKDYENAELLLSELIATLGEQELNVTKLAHFGDSLQGSTFAKTSEQQIIDEQIVKDGGGEKRRLLTDAISMIDQLLTELPKYQKAEVARDTETKNIEIVQRLLTHAVAARKEAVQAVVSDVASLANRFYEALHPNEGIATSSLSVRAAAQRSIDMGIAFHGTEGHPLRFFSESHLDTLGLCYFLAIRKREAESSPDFRLLVLDDVMHSVDADHRNRVAKLLKDEFGDFQLVITTHDERFYGILRQQLGTGGYTYCQVTNWTIENGPVLADPYTDLDRVTNEAIRNAMSASLLSGAAGRFFEWLLREVTESLAISLQARFKRSHDIGSMWPQTKSYLDKHRGFKQAHADLADSLNSSIWVRNASGAHYNEDASPATPSEVRDHAKLLADLYRAVCCEHCENFIVKQPDDSLRCLCGGLLYLKTPPARP